MSKFFTAFGVALLIFCAIWGYLWLEVLRDPKGELADFYAQYPRTKAWISRVNKLWIPTLVAGIFVVFSLMMWKK